MYRVEQDMNYDGDNHPVKCLVAALKQFHQHHGLRNGIDWQHQIYWAEMPDEDFLVFALKHPDLGYRFRKI
jgi:hypothetical protein